MKKSSTQKIAAPFEKGPSHIIQSLVGIYGSTPGDVINFIVKNWIGDNIELLEKFGIDIKVVGGTQVVQKYGDDL